MTAGSKVWSLRGYQWGSLAAICTWGDWRASLRPDPCQIDGTEPNRQWRCSLQRSGAREAIARGALTGVYVLDINHRPATAHEQPDTTGPPLEVGTARRARPHWRAGHWQNYRSPPETPPAPSPVPPAVNETTTGIARAAGCSSFSSTPTPLQPQPEPAIAYTPPQPDAVEQA